LTSAPSHSILGGSAEDNAHRLRAILSGEAGPHRDVVLLNAGAALVAADLAEGIREGTHVAAESIDSGAAKQRMEAFVELTRSFA
jgi:anthranilate phosphoribosyltransferase